MQQEAFDGIIRYLDHAIDNDRKIYKQVMKGRDYEAEMFAKSLSIMAAFLEDDMEFSGRQVKELLRYIYQVPFQE